MPRRKTETQADKQARRKRYENARECWRQFANVFIAGKRDFLFKGEEDGNVFSRETINEVLRRYSALRGINKEEPFMAKAKSCYARAPRAAKLVFAHALFAYKLIAKTSGTDRHKSFVNCLALGDFAGYLYWGGVSRTGQAYNQCSESIDYILRVFKSLVGKNPKTVKDVNKAIRAYCEKEFNDQPSGIKWMANVLLWYVAPDEYEPIIAQSDKQAIANCPAFVKLVKNKPKYSAAMANDDFKQNKVIALIRKEYAKKAGREWFSFYDSDVKRIWRG